ncbi:MAG: flavodoxin [Pirellulales bacterium]|nr:flavodoxin [Pirellulales bacterium]
MQMGIFYGSSTGNTEMAAEKIKEEMGELVPDEIVDISNASPEQLAQYDLLFLGVSTWNIGDMQDDWADFLPRLKEVDLKGKKVALFALGDQDGYPYNFLDAMGELWEVCKAQGAELVGVWSTEGYRFDESRAMYDEDHFVGLGLDEDNESELTEERIHTWLLQVVQEIGFDIGVAAE